jgi:hypothetical protein
MRLLEFSDVLRLYDVCFDLGKATMLDRVAGVLDRLSKAHKSFNAMQILHVEDEVYLAAAFGCTMGIMRHPLWGPNVKFQEVVRAVRWQRIAPPFGASKVPVKISPKILFDTRHFPPGSFWDNKVWDKDIHQGAPACMTRDIPLPLVENKLDPSGNDDPFVVAAKNPNGAISIGTLGRVNKLNGFHTPKAKIIIQIPSWNVPIGIFGEFDRLILEGPDILANRKIWTQDLGDTQAIEISNEVIQKGNQLEIPGELIHRIGTQTNLENDPSEPGLVLKIDF